ncbi:MAG TPA: carbohydrate binding domain-containing protein [Tepidisphaeraceae bacterium]|jgi:Tfp pilus assembly protein PilX
MNSLRRRHPRGSIYVLVLCVSMLVAVIGMGALLAARVQTRIARSEVDFATARLLARSGLEVAMFRIQQDPAWRTDLGNGTWFNNVPLNGGTFSVSASDPISGNVAAPSNDPVVLTCTGTRNAAVYMMKVTVQVNPSGLSCLNVATCSGSDTTLGNCAFTSNQIVSANGNVNLNGSSVLTANAQAVGNIAGGTISGSKTKLNQPLTLPDPVHVFDYYNANGTTLPLAALAQSNSNQLVSNTSFETNTNGWYVYSPSSSNVKLSLDASVSQDGNKSLLISNRSGSGDVPATDLPLLSIRNGDTYAVSVPVYGSALLGLGSAQATIVLQTSEGTQSFSTASQSFPLLGAGWVNCQGNLTLNWTGTLTKATLTVTCSSSSNLDIDKVSLTDTSLPSNAYVMDRVLLSPTSNPYGAPNPNGIYILNCNNQNVTITACRIVGTLVLIGAGSGTTIQGPITLEPAVAGYPALLSDSSIAIAMTGSAGLGEATYGVNFNPPGTPYPFVGGSANTNASDGFPSIINGLVFCGGDLTLSSSTAPTFNGCIVTAGKLNLNATSVNVTYGNGSHVAPPPGFGINVSALSPVAGSCQRVTH